jgi:hypothetical protein
MFDAYSEYGFVFVSYERLGLNIADAANPAWFFSLMLREQADLHGVTGLRFEEIMSP